MGFPPVHFIDEAIEAVFKQPPALEKSPTCPDGFVWNEIELCVVEMLSEWRDFKRRGKMERNMSDAHAAEAAHRGSWGVGRFFFRVRVEDGRVFDLYYDRAPQDVDRRKGAWFLFSERIGS